MATKKQLVSYVAFHNPNNGLSESFGPGDVLPEWAAKQANDMPHIWVDAVVGETNDERVVRLERELAAAQHALSSQPAAVPQAAPAASDDEDDSEDLADGDGEDEDAELPSVPPRTGKGSNAAAWAEYAEAANVDITGLTSRGDIIVALEAAGVPTA